MDITCEYCSVQRHECSVWRKIEDYADCTRREVWCCNECWKEGEELEKEACEEMGEEFTGHSARVVRIEITNLNNYNTEIVDGELVLTPK